MTNGNQKVENLKIEEIRNNRLMIGSATVNNVEVFFYYDRKEDKFMSSSLTNSDAAEMNMQQHNWRYLVCGSIAHLIKTSL